MSILCFTAINKRWDLGCMKNDSNSKPKTWVLFLFFLFYPKSLKFRKKSEPCEPLYRRYLVYNVLNLQRHVPAFLRTALKLFFFFNQQLVLKRSAQIRRHTVLHAENRFIYICQLSPAFFVFEFFYRQKGLGLGLETHSRSAGSRLIGS